MILHRGGNFGRLGGDCKPAGEIVERADLGLPLLRPDGIGARGGGELARRDRHDDEHRQVDELLGTGNAKVVDGRIEEERRDGHGCDGRDEGRHEAQHRRRDEHGQDVGDGDVRDPEHAVDP